MGGGERMQNRRVDKGKEEGRNEEAKTTKVGRIETKQLTPSI